MTRAHRNGFSDRPFRALGRVAAAIAGPAVVVAASLGVAAQAGGVPAGAWQSNALKGARTYGRLTVANNVLNAQAGPQTVWATSATNARVSPAMGQGIEPLQPMMNAKGLAVAELADYTFVFH